MPTLDQDTYPIDPVCDNGFCEKYGDVVTDGHVHKSYCSDCSFIKQHSIYREFKVVFNHKTQTKAIVFKPCGHSTGI